MPSLFPTPLRTPVPRVTIARHALPWSGHSSTKTDFFGLSGSCISSHWDRLSLALWWVTSGQESHSSGQGLSAFKEEKLTRTRRSHSLQETIQMSIQGQDPRPQGTEGSPHNSPSGPSALASPSGPHLTPITSQRIYLLVPSHWGVGFPHMNFGRDTNIRSLIISLR